MQETARVCPTRRVHEDVGQTLAVSLFPQKDGDPNIRGY